MQKVVIVGGGHAAAQLCASLIEGGFPGSVTLVCEEATLPYHRPPLSKTYLKTQDAAVQLLRPEATYADAGVQVLLADPAVAIDRDAHRLTLASGKQLDYDALVLATGTRARRLPDLPDDLQNLIYLRNAGDAARLRAAIAEAPSVTVVGGGFIGLEIAATAGALGRPVTVFESAPRLLARSVSPEASEHVARVLHESGVQLRLSSDLQQVRAEDGRVRNIVVNGEEHPVDLLVAGIGAVPETALAQAAGLECVNGIVVDALMQTSAPGIYAIGDCTSFPYARWGKTLRLESVQNANDQARTLAGVLLGTKTPYHALPWFWSDQGALRLQIAGLAPPDTERVLRPGAKPGSCSILHFADGHLVCVESINAPMDHLAARKLLELGLNPPREALTDPAVPLKSHY
ncbi:Rhodocoxin reductase [Achromobacter anxifer]|uniref:Rhodocoxin reductase n=1 Tax=Achromobacter anxifer TaxID=1287737 RepID=A0A6S7BUP7_9BURK|nr:FAD-dependent oxidoreductase [Achromobacter anxifer]CAB3817617.1 Rhodocoxin reductase [Achromobacter anxifer]